MDAGRYDAELRRHNEALRRACGVQLHDHVLDIGCGAGQTTREAARTAQAGSAHGVDISAPAIERARELARAEGSAMAAALDWVRGFTSTSAVLERLDPAAAARAVERLREALVAHLSDDGVWLDSRAWIVTARRH